MGYGGERGNNRSHLMLAAAEDKGRQAAALDKRCQFVKARSYKAEREVDKLILNLKLRAKEEGSLYRRWPQGVTVGRGGGH